MIIKYVKLNNFFRFFGEHMIEMARDKNMNVTIIRGENGSGKTTLLNAFYWTLYGDLMEPFTREKMLNYNTISHMENNDTRIASVEIQFEDDGNVYTIERSQRFIKKNNQIFPMSEENIYISYVDHFGNLKRIDNEPEKFFESIIPSRLRGFFFFDGERINRLAQVDGKEEIKEAILSILGLNNLENIDKQLDLIRREYVKEINKANKKATGNEVETEYDKLNEAKVKLIQEYDQAVENQKQAKKVIEKANEYLMEHNSAVIKELQTQRSEMEENIVTLSNNNSEIAKSLRNHFSREFKNYLITKFIDGPKKLLDEKREKGELPSDVKVQFIDDLIDRKLCICGRDLKFGSEEYEKVNAYKKVAGRTELDDAYVRITAYIQQSMQQRDEFYQITQKLLNDKTNNETQIEMKKKAIDEVTKKLKNSNEEDIKAYEEMRSKAQEDRDNYTAKKAKIDNEIKEIDKEIKIIEKKIIDAENMNEEAAKYKKFNSAVEGLIGLNTEIRQYFIKQTRENLDQKIKEVFSSISRKPYRQALLTENFELKIINTMNGNEDAQSLSTGEGQITSLSFIGSLVSYSREKKDSTLLSEFAGGDFPIVMDSPFGNLDSLHTEHVAAGIGKLSSQVIIVVSDKQWSKEVEMNITPQVGKMYRIVDGELNHVNQGEYSIVKQV